MCEGLSDLDVQLKSLASFPQEKISSQNQSESAGHLRKQVRNMSRLGGSSSQNMCALSGVHYLNLNVK